MKDILIKKSLANKAVLEKITKLTIIWDIMIIKPVLSMGNRAKGNSGFNASCAILAHANCSGWDVDLDRQKIWRYDIFS